MIQRAYKYRIYPTVEQKEFFAKCFGCVRFFYNKSLDDMKKEYEIHKKFKDITPAFYKEEFTFLKEVDSLALSNAQLNRNKAFKAFFKKQNKFPKYKSKRSKQSYTTNNQHGSVFLSEDNRYISLPKIKNIRIKLHRIFDGIIKSVTVSKTCDNKYYVSLLVIEEDKRNSSTSNKAIGIDLGIKSFSVDSNNIKVENPKYFSKSQNRLAKEQRKLSHMKKGSNNYKKQCIKIASIYCHITNQRDDFLQKLSSQYINDNQVIVCEDLDVMNMEQNKDISKNIMDASWSKFVSYLSYKALWNNKTFIKVPRSYPSSQLCSSCGYQNKLVKDLSIRKWTCPECGTNHDRDYNASKNILKKGLEILRARTSPVSL